MNLKYRFIFVNTLQLQMSNQRRMWVFDFQTAQKHPGENPGVSVITWFLR